ncbi:hypothetical protein [Roseovarius sp. 2305UL8-3]|uniref:hypothetical protein n=1 Tax=Roseovarius conchicola TaxID=3121636 RepID=UPI003528F38D
MTGFDGFDWANSSAEAQLEMARRADAEQLRQLARSYDWRMFPDVVLGWVMAQKAIDLGSALNAFLMGEPERFNYLRKREVPQKYQGTVRVLDNICLRVNSGFYLSLPGSEIKHEKRLQNWLRYQQEDRSEHVRGRWILDERILRTLSDDTLKLDPNAAAAPRQAQNSLWRDMLEPVTELGVSREYLKYLPEGH